MNPSHGERPDAAARSAPTKSRALFRENAVHRLWPAETASSVFRQQRVKQISRRKVCFRSASSRPVTSTLRRPDPRQRLERPSHQIVDDAIAGERSVIVASQYQIAHGLSRSEQITAWQTGCRRASPAADLGARCLEEVLSIAALSPSFWPFSSPGHLRNPRNVVSWVTSSPPWSICFTRFSVFTRRPDALSKIQADIAMFLFARPARPEPAWFRRLLRRARRA